MVLIDGEERDAIPVDDPGFAAGYAVFETMRTYGGQPYGLDEHLERLRRSAEHCRITMPEISVLHAEIGEVIAAIPGEARINVTLTGGGRRVVKARALDLTWVGRQMKVVSKHWTADPWLPGWVKHTSRLATWMACDRADEALWIAPEGVWTECTQSNLFVVRGGALWTPPDDGRILRGVTRGGMILAARSIGIDVRELPVTVGPCDEMWLASTLKELAPVVELDGEPAAGAGPVGEALRAAFRLAVTRGG